MAKARRAALEARVRGRIWFERSGALLLNEAGADLLEQINACGSLSEAARRLGFSYRRAWMLIEAMNRRWPQRVVSKSTGGKRGGGSRVTTFGHAVLGAFRDLQVQVETLLDHQQAHCLALLRAGLH